MDQQELRQLTMQAFELWTQGNQAGAVDVIRPAADQNAPEAVALICWFLYQMGEPRWREGIPYMEKAMELGLPQVSGYYIGNLINDTNLRPKAVELLRSSMEAGWPHDPVGYVTQAFQAGDRDTATELIELGGMPRPTTGAWEQVVGQARADLGRLQEAAGDVEAKREQASARIETDANAVNEQRVSVETRSQQLIQLIEQITSAEAQTFFDEEAKKYEEESATLWNWGVGVLAAAGFISVLPLLIYYGARLLGKHSWLAGHDLFAAHVTPAIAFGAVAGVLLARSRGRDRARQRARDLSVALATMFVYSGQISDEGERQQFLRDMGRSVLEAFLRQEGGGPDSDTTGLLSALRRV